MAVQQSGCVFELGPISTLRPGRWYQMSITKETNGAAREHRIYVTDAYASQMIFQQTRD